MCRCVGQSLVCDVCIGRGSVYVWGGMGGGRRGGGGGGEGERGGGGGEGGGKGGVQKATIGNRKMSRYDYCHSLPHRTLVQS